MGKSDLKRAATKHSQNLGDPSANLGESKGILTDLSANVVDQSVHSSVSTTLTPKVNIDTATTKAAASTTLDASSSVPEQGIYLFILYLMLTIYNYYNKKIK